MEALSRNWGWLLALGILMVILGVFLIGAPMVATIAVQLFLGWILIIGGIGEGIHAFMVKEWRGFMLELLSAILYVVIGVLLLNNPVEGALALTLVLAIFLVVEGIFKVVMGFQVRGHDGWVWLVASGVLSLILGAMIWSEWPSSALWVIGLLVGIQLLFTGWSLIMLAMAARAARDRVAPAA